MKKGRRDRTDVISQKATCLPPALLIDTQMRAKGADMAKAKLHVHEPRWYCQACGYIFASQPAATRPGEAEPQPQACPECGSKSIRRMEEGRF